MKKFTGFMLAGTLLMGISLVGCGGNSAAPAQNNTASGSQATPAKEYVVGTDASYAPFEYVNDKQEIVGFDIDLMKAVADKGGFKVKFVNTPWEGIFNALKQGDRDILISAITITDDRKQDLDFSNQYYESQQLICLPNNSKITKFDDLKGKIVGVQTGTTGEDYLTKLLGKNSPNIKRYESNTLALQELQNGGLDAVVADNGVVNYYIKNNAAKGFKAISDNSFTKEYYGIAVKKGNTEVLNKINTGLKAIQDDGTFKKISDQYFGTTK